MEKDDGHRARKRRKQLAGEGLFTRLLLKALACAKQRCVLLLQLRLSCVLFGDERAHRQHALWQSELFLLLEGSEAI